MMFPQKIAQILQDKTGHADNIGMSGSNVTIYDDCVLKISDATQRSCDTVAVMQWLEGRISAARVIHHELADGKSWLLMTKVPGTMSCDSNNMCQPGLLLQGLAKGMHLMWQTDHSGCPRTTTVADLLKEAEILVGKGLVDIENTEPETFGPGGFRNPEHLLSWLSDNMPESDLVIAHGDYCLPNIFMDEGQFSGFIDLDDFGIGERWRDIALCYRSLKHNSDGHFGAVYNIDPLALFSALEIRPDWDLIRYHLLLDELL